MNYSQMIHHLQFKCVAIKNFTCERCNLDELMNTGLPMSQQKFTKEGLIKHLEEDCPHQAVECKECFALEKRSLQTTHTIKDCLATIKSKVQKQNDTIKDLKVQLDRLKGVQDGRTYRFMFDEIDNDDEDIIGFRNPTRPP